MNWDDLKIFDAAAGARSLSGAAKRVGLSQPQLTRRLRQLETEIGARLFERTPQGLKPTQAGLRLMPLAAEMRQAADAVEQALPELKAARLRVVRISVDEVRERLLTDRLSLLLEALDGIEIELISSQEQQNHITRETEIQLRSCLPETDSLIARKLGHIAYAVYGGLCYVAKTPASQSESRFTHCRWIGFAPDRLWYPEHRQWLATQGVQHEALRVNTMTAAQDATAGGAGLAVLPCFLADTDDRLVRVSEPIAELRSVEHVIIHRDLLREPAIRCAIDALIALYRDAARVLDGCFESKRFDAVKVAASA
ncbi:MAG: LysR family transcriptional regulator [Pseudomonadota bacterium]